ncbi:MAG: hypothetical protein M1816_002031, partial [Peltula sp. TS41687]
MNSKESTSSSHLHSIVKLKGSQNYDVWSMKVQMVLIREGLWDVTELDEQPAPGSTDDPAPGPSKDDKTVDRDLDRKARATIILAMDDSLVDHVIGEKTARA